MAHPFCAGSQVREDKLAEQTAKKAALGELDLEDFEMDQEDEEAEEWTGFGDSAGVGEEERQEEATENSAEVAEAGESTPATEEVVEQEEELPVASTSKSVTKKKEKPEKKKREQSSPPVQPVNIDYEVLFDGKGAPLSLVLASQADLLFC